LLLAGAILAPDRHTVAAALRILGRDHDPGTTCPRRESSSREPLPGIQKLSWPSATRSRRSAAKYGLTKFTSSPGRTEIP
jgi:hypothetical protein